MPDSLRQDRLLPWSLGTFHASFFVVALVILLYSLGVLGNLLSSLDTLAGLALFATLWYTTWWCTRRALHALLARRAGTESILAVPIPIWEVLRQGALWGGINGVLFFLVLLLLATALLILPNSSLDALLVVLIYALIGSGIAAIIGALSGLVLAILDSVLVMVMRHIDANSAILGWEANNPSP